MVSLGDGVMLAQTPATYNESDHLGGAQGTIGGTGRGLHQSPTYLSPHPPDQYTDCWQTRTPH